MKKPMHTQRKSKQGEIAIEMEKAEEQKNKSKR